MDDLGISGKDMKIIDILIGNLKKRGFKLTKEGTFAEYLGIQYTNLENGSILIKQPGLIQKIIEATDVKSCNLNRTPTTTEALRLDPEGKRMTEKWNYRSKVGMFLYLSTNTRPDISYAVSQVAMGYLMVEYSLNTLKVQSKLSLYFQNFLQVESNEHCCSSLKIYSLVFDKEIIKWCTMRP